MLWKSILSIKNDDKLKGVDELYIMKYKLILTQTSIVWSFILNIFLNFIIPLDWPIWPRSIQKRKGAFA